MKSDWANLPEDILDLVHENLFPWLEYTRFGYVRKSWLRVAVNNSQRRQKRLGQCDEIPMLAMPTEEDDHNNGRAAKTKLGLYSFLGDKVCGIQLPSSSLAANHRICGSSKGWLAIVDYSRCIITLFNPFRDKIISLPPIERLKVVFKVVVSERFASSSEINGDNYVVAANLDITHPLENIGVSAVAFIRSGGETWRRQIHKYRPVRDIFIYKERLHVMVFGGKFFYYNVCNDYVPGQPPDWKYDVRHKTEICDEGSGCDHYVVKTSTGKLLLFVRVYTYGNLKTSYFEVLETNELLMWDKVRRNLLSGEDAFFVDDYNVTCVKACPSLGCKPNHIYSTNDFSDRVCNSIGIYDIKDATSRRHNKLTCRGLSSIWISVALPKFQFKGNSSIIKFLKNGNSFDGSVQGHDKVNQTEKTWSCTIDESDSFVTAGSYVTDELPQEIKEEELRDWIHFIRSKSSMILFPFTKR